ncbi:MBOAT family O-acyltransferase [Fortiea contorta]|uniref:MBOAT family O-acyltransferase n=1 Tax=Fortiea contorta TaxID=1892405 RepID=UPI000346FF32|nr:MBOAT family protein [Fortiea contorta]
MLLIASYIFYAWLDVRLVFLIIFSTVIVFYCGGIIGTGRLNGSSRNLITKSLYPQLAKLTEAQTRLLFLRVGICATLFILGFFKYFNFFSDSAEAVISTIGLKVNLFHLNIVLIAGVSFYIFKAISYLVDIYKNKVEATNNFINFALFLAFFPPLLAGPIDRASQLLPQLENPRKLSFEQSVQGIFLILFGLFKKVAIADGISPSVDAVYQATNGVSWLSVVVGTLYYTIQIYCDFSGYSDMAIGVSKLFGIELMVNFNLPYFSKDPSEFWNRWHISLSSWLRDYLYIPLGGSRRGNLATYRNLMITMILGGLWHGAAWNFVIWGFYQGAVLCIYRFFGTKKNQETANNKFLVFIQGLAATLIFFVLTCYGWLLFRATSLEQIITFTKILFLDVGNLALNVPKPPLSALMGIPVLIGYEILGYIFGKPDFRYRFPIPARAAFYAIVIFILLMGQSNAPTQFIYSTF